MVVRDPLDQQVRIDRDARIHGWGDVWRLFKTNRTGPVLYLVHDRRSKLYLTHREYNTEALRPGFVCEVDYFRPSSIGIRARKLPFSTAHLPKKDQLDVNYKIHCLTIFYKLHYQRGFKRTAKGFGEAAKLINQELGVVGCGPKFKIDDATPAPTNRGCRNNVVAVLNGSTLRRFVDKVEAAEWDLSELRDGRHASGNHTKRFSPETDDLLKHYSREYCKLHCPTRLSVYADFLIAHNEMNKRFRTEDRECDPTPSFSRFCLEVTSLDRFEVDLLRLGRDAAHRKWKLIGAGLRVVHALERVEMDFCRVDLHTLLVDTIIWKQMSPHLRKKIERKRWYACVALDVASRCVVGMKLAQSENAIKAIETLRMVCQDKSHIARAAGALSPWDQHGSPMSVVTDQGSSFISGYFQHRVVSLLSDIFNPPAAQPQLRAFIERFFRTVLDSLLRRFEGNTGGGIEALGDYPAQLRAVLTVDEFSDLLIRWCVDIYHNKKHAGLGGETPRDAWMRLTRDMPPMPAPTPTRMRISFGLDLQRPTRRTGIRILGLDYNSKELQDWCLKKGDAEVEVKLDPADIGAISARLDPDSMNWITIPCRTRFMDGRRLDVWLLAADELSRRFDAVARMRLPVVLAAVEGIERTHRQASYVAEVGTRKSDQDHIAYFEDKLALGFSVPASEDQSIGAWTGLEPSQIPVAASNTLPSPYALPGSRSFAVGGTRIARGLSQRPINSGLPFAAESDGATSDETDTSAPDPDSKPERSAVPLNDPIAGGTAPAATQAEAPRRRRSNVRMEN